MSERARTSTAGSPIAAILRQQARRQRQDSASPESRVVAEATFQTITPASCNEFGSVVHACLDSQSDFTALVTYSLRFYGATSSFRIDRFSLQPQRRLQARHGHSD
jgi:hypothetical protein